MMTMGRRHPAGAIIRPIFTTIITPRLLRGIITIVGTTIAARIIITIVID